MGRRCSAGISNIWKIVTGREPPFERCCDDHDDAYRGYDVNNNPVNVTRREADRKMCACIAGNGWPILAALMYYGVRGPGHFFWRYWWQTKLAKVKRWLR